MLNSFNINLDAFDIANQAFDAMQSTIARQKLAAYPPDIILDIPQNLCGTMEFDKAEDVIAYGYKATAALFNSHS